MTKRVCQSGILAGSLLIASHLSCVAACDISDNVRYAAYRPFLELATDETTAIFERTGNHSFQAASEELIKKSVPLLEVGGAKAVRLLIGLGLFTAVAANKEPLDVTHKLACTAAKEGLAPRNVADPLTCAVISVDWSRRDSVESRTLAREMLELAKSNLASDPNPADARRRLEIVGPVVESCAR